VGFVPEDFVAGDPSRAAPYARLLADTLHPDRAERWAVQAVRAGVAVDPGVPGTIALGRAVLAACVGDDVAYERHMAEAGEYPPADLVLSELADSWRVRLASLVEGPAREPVEGDPTGVAALAAAIAGDLLRAEALVRVATDGAGPVPTRRWVGTADAVLARAALRLEAGALDEADALLSSTVARGGVSPLPWFEAIVAVLAAGVARARGRPADAVALLEDRDLVGRVVRGSALHGFVGEALVQAALAAGDVRRAERVLARIEPVQPWARSRTRIDLAMGRREDARCAMRRLQPTSIRRRVEVGLLAARVELDADRARARAILGRTTALGIPAGLRWTFEQEPELGPLLDEILEPAQRAELAACRPPRQPLAVVPAVGTTCTVGERELAVLRLLPTHLSIREIATELFVSQNTVKTHIRSLYRKLGAASRSEAVMEARRHELIEPVAAHRPG
jgi:LuxR family maltose regulon positive regulatory protein